MIKEALKKFTKKLALALCVSAMCIGGAAVSAQAAESAEVQESSEGSAEISGIDDYLNFGQVESGAIEGHDETIYEVKVSKSGRVTINFVSYDAKFMLYMYDSNGDEMDYWYMDYNDTLGFAKDSLNIDLLAGTYYFKIYNTYYDTTGSYKIKATFVSAGANEKEPNDNYKTAMPIKLSTVVRGQIAFNDKVDFFKFKITQKSEVKIKVTSSQLGRIYVYLYDSNGDEINYDYIYANDTEVINKTLTYMLGAGTYYIGVNEGYYTGAYAFKVSSPITLGSKNVKLSKTKYEYDGKVKSPAVIVKDNSGRRLVKGRDYDVYAQSGRRNVGIYKVKVVFKGNYKGSAVKTLTIIPARTTITGIANKNNGIKIAWKQRKAGNATGYIVYRSVNGGAYKAIKVIRSTRTTAFTDTGANSWWDTYSYKVVVYKNLGGKTYKSVGSNGKSIYRY